MNNLIKFPSLSYEYDFSIPGTVSKDNALQNGGNPPEPLRIGYYVRDEEIIGLFGSAIEPLQLDWVDLAVAVYIADRLSLREIEKQYRNIWKRQFNIKIAVRKPEFWLSQNVQSELKNVLNYFTDDDWEFEFIPLEAKDRMDEIQRKLPIRPNNPSRIALYSGGLDSFAGAAQQLFLDKESSFVFISGATNTRQVSLQSQQIKELRENYQESEIIHHTIKFGFRWSDSEHPKEENSQRTRGFLFTTLGAVVALNAGVNNLEIYENGIGAINLPYDNSQIGTMSSRAVNPLALLRMEKFIEKLTGKNFQISNLYLFHTKGEMCRHDAVKNLAHITSLTFSCDGFPVRTSGKPQCGVCTSCLLRRLSLETANLSDFDDGEHYLTNLTDPSSNPSSNQLNNLRAMEWQYQMLKNLLSQENPWQILITEYPALQTIVSELVAFRNFQAEELQNRILLLYSQYCLEWTKFSARQNHIQMKKKAA